VNHVRDTANPDFYLPIVVNRHLYSERTLRFVVVDVDEESEEVSNEDVIGCADWKIEQLIQSPDLTLTMPLTCVIQFCFGL